MNLFWNLGCWGSCNISNIQCERRKEKILKTGCDLDNHECTGLCSSGPPTRLLRPSNSDLDLPHPSQLEFQPWKGQAHRHRVRWPWERRRTGWRCLHVESLRLDQTSSLFLYTSRVLVNLSKLYILLHLSPSLSTITDFWAERGSQGRTTQKNCCFKIFRQDPVRAWLAYAFSSTSLSTHFP
jgi:hypothetical protein